MSTKSGSVRSATQYDPVEALHKQWGWLLALGIAMIALGAVAIAIPMAVTVAVELLLGWIFVIGGFVQGTHAFRSRGEKGAFLSLLGAALYLAVGILLLAFPLQCILTLTLLLALFFLMEGVFKMAAAWQVRSMHNWGWLFFSGVVAFALGVFIWLVWPTDAAWLLGLLVGVDLIFGGCCTVMVATAVHSTPYHPAHA